MLRVRPCASGPPAVASAGMIHSRARHWTGIYAELSKAKLSALVVATTTGGFLFAGAPIAWPALAAVTVGTSLAACSANTFNQTIEHEYDALMVRPLPTGRISTAHAAMFGVASGVASTALLAAFTNPLTAGLGAANILLVCQHRLAVAESTRYAHRPGCDYADTSVAWKYFHAFRCHSTPGFTRR
jgi:protoheme IX farnesyltransferase